MGAYPPFVRGIGGDQAQRKLFNKEVKRKKTGFQKCKRTPRPPKIVHQRRKIEKVWATKSKKLLIKSLTHPKLKQKYAHPKNKTKKKLYKTETFFVMKNPSLIFPTIQPDKSGIAQQ